jgi:hypothetical protein
VHQQGQGEQIVALARHCVRWGLLSMSQLEELDAHPLVGKYDAAVRLVAGWYLGAMFGRRVTSATATAVVAHAGSSVGQCAGGELSVMEVQVREEERQQDLMWERASRPRCKLASSQVSYPPQPGTDTTA